MGVAAESSGAILGLWDGHGAGVALLAEGQLIFALAEERCNRRKRFSGFPVRSLALAREHAQAASLSIQHVVVAGRRGRTPLRLLEPLYASSDPRRQPLGRSSRAAMAWENTVPLLPGVQRAEARLGRSLLLRRLASVLPEPFKLHRVDHHDAHAFSALFGAGRVGALVLTADAYGEGRSATLRFPGAPGQAVEELGPDMGLALLFGAVTVALGFREGDEGKVMGLAAHGDPRPGLARFQALFHAGEEAPRLRRSLSARRVRRLLVGLERQDAAASLQRCVQEQCLRWVESIMSRRRLARRMLLAGGLFANVRLNQALAELPRIRELFVFPAMGDEGLAAGAAHWLWYRSRGALAQPMERAALGRIWSAAALELAARNSGLRVARVDPVASGLRHLDQGRVLCRFRGRDELGPRALGNRSVLFRADQPRLGERVNAALERDPIMAFAPSMAAEAAPEALAGSGLAASLGWMTVTAPASAGLARSCPVAVHVDGTTRPQLVEAGVDPGYHALLRGWWRIAGQPALINTSFNLHGEPIVHSPEDAVKTFLASGLDVLQLGDWELVAPQLADD